MGRPPKAPPPPPLPPAPPTRDDTLIGETVAAERARLKRRQGRAKTDYTTVGTALTGGGVTDQEGSTAMLGGGR